MEQWVLVIRQQAAQDCNTWKKAKVNCLTNNLESIYSLEDIAGKPKQNWPEETELSL